MSVEIKVESMSQDPKQKPFLITYKRTQWKLKIMHGQIKSQSNPSFFLPFLSILLFSFFMNSWGECCLVRDLSSLLKFQPLQYQTHTFEWFRTRLHSPQHDTPTRQIFSYRCRIFSSKIRLSWHWHRSSRASLQNWLYDIAGLWIFTVL